MKRKATSNTNQPSQHDAKSDEKSRGGRLFRFMAHQPVSVTMKEPSVVEFQVADKDCRFFLMPVHDDPSAQRAIGGSWIHVEFTDDDPDIIRATALGLRIVDDLLSGLSLVTAIDFRDSSPAQIVDLTTAAEARFMVFLNSDYKHRSTPITAADVGRVQGIIAHWDGLPRGSRLRRASRLFRQAVGEDDEVSAFQTAYMGLESLEPLLAEVLEVRAGAEEVKGQCEKCGFEYTRLRTTLNAVRNYIRRDYHPDLKSPEREGEWKRISSHLPGGFLECERGLVVRRSPREFRRPRLRSWKPGTRLFSCALKQSFSGRFARNRAPSTPPGAADQV